MLRRILVVAVLAGLPAIAAVAGKPGTSRDSVIGRRIPNFLLSDAAGKQIAMADFNESRFLVVVFIGTKCPVGNAYIPVLLDLQREYRGKGVQVVGINPNPGDSADDIAGHVKEFAITFPVLLDGRQTALPLFGAQRTPEVFLLDGRRVIRYQGRIDDQFAPDHRRDAPSRHDLREALEELIAGKTVSVPQIEPAGCRITRLAQAKKGEVTYNRDVTPILRKHCIECHHPGTAAPFSLLSYDSAFSWSEMIGEVVTLRRMPPWHADPRFGQFANERRLSPEEIETLATWVADGAPRGEPVDAPPPPTFTDGWRIGTPDAIFRLPEEVTIPAKGKVDYRYFRTKTNFKQDVWVQAVEARPGNKAAVHHIVVGYIDTRVPPAAQALVWLGSYTPGGDPVIFTEGLARTIPAGADLAWEVHYVTTGKEEKDRSELGLVFAKTPPKHEVLMHGISNTKLRLPPGAANHRVVAEVPVGRDSVLLSFFPHMHLRGKDFDYEVIYPGGRRQVILFVPQYDFNWQLTYRLREPLRVPRGSKIRCIAHYDNSAENPANPDPKKEVRWGRDSTDEMMIGYLDYYWDDLPRLGP
jgi:peroxiredoxin